MIAKKMEKLVKGSSVIRAMFEEGKLMAKKYGAENVYDFSLGNPSVNPPEQIKESIIKILEEEKANYLHGYMSNSGYEDVRQKIAESINQKYSTSFDQNNIIMTVGAAGGLNVILKSIINPLDEVIVFAPYFGEYANYVTNYDGILVEVEPNTLDFQPNLEVFAEKITSKTKAVIINTPNNPTGVVYSEDTLKKLANILYQKEQELGTCIYLISDEPYRELVYDGENVPYVTKFYNNTIVGYSYSKSLSLPGERIGYLVIPSDMDYYEDVYGAACVANRILGFVNAPSLMQRVVAQCIDAKVDIEVYNRNRELLYNSLLEYGYECIKPQGAFYLFVKAPGGDDVTFVNEAKKKRILLVPGSSFGCPGYCRIAYCVSYDTIKNSLDGFKELISSL